MVGRTPEYLGKKIEAREVTLAALVVLLPSALLLIGTAVAVVLPAARASGACARNRFCTAWVVYRSATFSSASNAALVRPFTLTWRMRKSPATRVA